VNNLNDQIHASISQDCEDSDFERNPVFPDEDDRFQFVAYFLYYHLLMYMVAPTMTVYQPP
jgi:hypothetical protein